MKYEHIFLDADNTLLDFDAAQEGAFKGLLSLFGVEYTDEVFARYSEINHGYWRRLELGTVTKDKLQTERFEVFFAELGLNIDGVEANDFYQKSLSEQCQHMPYAEQVCAELQKRGKLTIVTNGVGSTAYSRMSNSGLVKYMSAVVVSEVIGYAKPAREFFDAAFDIAGVKAGDRVIIVGDSLSSDIQGGINAGIDTCWFNPKGAVAPEGMNITYTITDLRELLDIIE